MNPFDTIDVDVRPSTPDDAYVLKNLYPLYVYELSAFYPQKPNAHGILDDDPALRTLSEQADTFDLWWRKPGVLFPYLVRVDSRPAGFALVASPPHIASGTDFLMNEFFVMHTYRGTHVARAAAADVLARHPGRWHAYVLPRNTRALAFWRRTLRGVTSYEERVGQTILGPHDLHAFSWSTAA